MVGDLIRPDEFRRIADRMEMQKMHEALEKKRKADEAQHEVREAFMAREIHPEVFDRLSRVVKAAAERVSGRSWSCASRASTAPMAAARSTAWKPTGRRH
jgi:hypothetical protein